MLTTHLHFSEDTVLIEKNYKGKLTNEVGQQEHQGDGDENGTEGGTFPVAVLVGFLQAEGGSREGVPWQGAGRWRIHRAGRQRVTGRRSAVQGRSSARLEQKMSGETQRTFLLTFTKHRALDYGAVCVL